MNQTTTPSSSGRGGKREGAGRPANSMSKLAREAREQAQETGMLPHEILLDMARGKPIKTLVPIEGANGLDPMGNQLFAAKFVVPDFEQMKDAAKAAAPYYAPKISTVEMITGLSEDDLDAIIAGAAAEAGVSLGSDGESEEDETPEGSGVVTRTRVRTDR